MKAEIADKQARSIKYQMSGAKLPLAKELADFDFTDTPVNEPLVRELAVGGFLANQRNAVLIGGTGTGKSHLAVGAGLHPRWRPGPLLQRRRPGRLEAEAPAGRQGRLADQLARRDLVILDELGYLPFVGGDEKPRLDGDFSDIGHRGAVAAWFAGGSWLGAAVGK